MKHVIWIPALNEVLPEGAVAYSWCDELDANCEDVVAAIVPDAFTTAGTVLYDSANGITSSKPLVHTFAGWPA